MCFSYAWTGPQGLGKAVWSRWKEWELCLPVREGGSPLGLSAVTREVNRAAHMLAEHLWASFLQPAEPVSFAQWRRLLLYLSSWHSQLQVLAGYGAYSHTRRKTYTAWPQGTPLTIIEPCLCVVVMFSQMVTECLEEQTPFSNLSKVTI